MPLFCQGRDGAPKVGPCLRVSSVRIILLEKNLKLTLCPICFNDREYLQINYFRGRIISLKKSHLELMLTLQTSVHNCAFKIANIRSVYSESPKPHCLLFLEHVLLKGLG